MMAARHPAPEPSARHTPTAHAAPARPHHRSCRPLIVALCALLLVVPAASAQMIASPSRAPARTAAPLTPEAIADLTLREIGPANMSGRIVDLAVNERNPYVFYVASATGGVWKTTNNGVTYEPVFENQGTHSVGAIALHPQDTALVWVGTGERASRQSSSWGDGVYRSNDGGRTWTHMGLRDSHHIGRIALHPNDPDIVFVAAMGHLWGANEERGLYKSTDGGTTWRRTLYVDENTGVVDVAIDPEQPAIMYAASYQRRRTPYAFHGGGPGSALWRSDDGGETWTKLGPTPAVLVAANAGGGDGANSSAPADDAAATGEGTGASDAAGDSLRVNGGINAIGLPAGAYGRIGISIHRADPRIVIASIEQGWRYNASTAYVERRAGVYRSEDRGLTWEHMSEWNPRPMYASQPLIDPSDPQRIYMMNAFSYSDDGGRTFEVPRQSLHGDDRILWVNPEDSRHLIKGDDGGVGISYDRGVTWLYTTNLPLSQWYRVSLDNAKPFRIYGGLQDNGGWFGPSATYREEGILNEDWTRIAGGDGFLALPDTVDGSTIYSESQYLGLARLDRATLQRRDIRPGDPRGAIGDRRNYDAWFGGTDDPAFFNAMAPANWDAPYIISPHDNHTLYAGTNRLWVSRDRGATWTDLGDLTSGIDRRTLPVMGLLPNDTIPSIDDGVPYWPTLTAIAESPIIEGLIYVGTDDGRLHVSRDGGATFTNVTSRLPGLPDMAWINGIEPSHHANGTVYVVVNNYRNDDVANYLYQSTDFGQTWTRIEGDLPANRTLRTVREDPRNRRVLWLGTEMGAFVTTDRGAHWTEIRNGMPLVAVNDLAVHPRDNDLVLATHGRGIWILDNVNALQELTPEVRAEALAVFTVEPAEQIRYAGEKAHTGDMHFAGTNPPEGAIIDYWLREAQDSGDVHIAILADDREIAEVEPNLHRGINRVLWDLRHARLPARAGSDGNGPAGPLVVPGTYTVRLSVGGETSEQPIEVREDPRLSIDTAVRAQWTASLLEIAALYREVNEEAARIAPLVEALDESDDDPRSRTIRDADALADELLARVRGLYGDVSSWTGEMTADQQSRLAYYREMLGELVEQR